VIADTDEIYRLPPSGLEQRVAEIFGKQYRSSLISFEEDTSYVRIHGLLGDPKITKKSRGEQFIFVNGRPVQHRFLSHIILKVYDNWTGDREYPFYALFLELDPEKVDVNVHPAKMEVKFDDERSVIQLTQSVVKKALNQYLMVPEIDSSASAGRSDFDTSFQNLSGFNQPDRSGNMHMPSRINFDSRGFDGKEIGRQLYKNDRDQETQPAESEKQTEISRDRELGFWQLHDRYILTQTRTGLCVIDQYRAHMRIIYEKALSATEEALPGTQQLLFAQTTEFSATDFSLLKELLPIIQRMGFSIELLSGHAAIITGVPADIDIGDEQKVLKEMLQKYREYDKNLKIDARKKVAVAFASRTAIPRGKRLTSFEMETLIDQLFACEEPYKDPLEKPTLVYMPMDEIGRRFG
jgi:DNA mismatch repair protein MutL